MKDDEIDFGKAIYLRVSKYERAPDGALREVYDSKGVCRWTYAGTNLGDILDSIALTGPERDEVWVAPASACWEAHIEAPEYVIKPGDHIMIGGPEII